MWPQMVLHRFLSFNATTVTNLGAAGVLQPPAKNFASGRRKINAEKP